MLAVQSSRISAVQTEALYEKTIVSPIGELKLIASSRGLVALQFHGGAGSKNDFAGEEIIAGDHYPSLLAAERQLAEYFAGKRKKFDLPLAPRGTVFQLKAWRELSKIPYGETISYGEQARRMGDANKARPAGAANGRNPIAVIVPCHRVIGATGAMTGFGGGIRTKEWLLKHEQDNA